MKTKVDALIKEIYVNEALQHIQQLRKCAEEIKIDKICLEELEDQLKQEKRTIYNFHNRRVS